MNQETRIQKIEAIINTETPYGKQEIPWRGSLKSFNVYQIPLEYLVYNKYNGRILSKTLSWEKQSHDINVETKEGKELIESFLWHSKESANENTLKSLQSIGQEKVGIVTKDGIIIDGNRRAMLLNKSGKNFFKAIVLDVTIQADRNSIEELETTYQMGEDEKLAYNPVEIYLKAWGLAKRNIEISDIAKWMNESESKINNRISVKELMDEYLSYLGYDGMYTQIGPGQEDLFISLSGWTKNFYGLQSGKVSWGYNDGDVDDLKFLAFDYIRVKFGTEDKSFRKIANGLAGSHLFGNKEIWSSFLEEHNKKVRNIKDQELPIDFNVGNLEKHLESRDQLFRGKALPIMEQNFKAHLTKLGDRQAKDRPEELASGALNKLDNIEVGPGKVLDTETINRLETILIMTKKKLGGTSPIPMLEGIIQDLNLIKDKSFGELDAEILVRVKEINKITFEIKKALGE